MPNWFDAAQQAVSAAASGDAEGAVEAGEEAVEAGTDAASEAAENVAEAVGGAVDGATDAGSEAAHGTAEDAGQTASSIVTMVNDVADRTAAGIDVDADPSDANVGIDASITYDGEEYGVTSSLGVDETAPSQAGIDVGVFSEVDGVRDEVGVTANADTSEGQGGGQAGLDVGLYAEQVDGEHSSRTEAGVTVNADSDLAEGEGQTGLDGGVFVENHFDGEELSRFEAGVTVNADLEGNDDAAHQQIGLDSGFFLENSGSMDEDTRVEVGTTVNFDTISDPETGTTQQSSVDAGFFFEGEDETGVEGRTEAGVAVVGDHTDGEDGLGTGVFSDAELTVDDEVVHRRVDANASVTVDGNELEVGNSQELYVDGEQVSDQEFGVTVGVDGDIHGGVYTEDQDPHWTDVTENQAGLRVTTDGDSVSLGTYTQAEHTDGSTERHTAGYHLDDEGISAFGSGPEAPVPDDPTAGDEGGEADAIPDVDDGRSSIESGYDSLYRTTGGDETEVDPGLDLSEFDDPEPIMGTEPTVSLPDGDVEEPPGEHDFDGGDDIELG